MFEYKYGSYYTDFSGCIGCGRDGYPPNMAPGAVKEYIPDYYDAYMVSHIDGRPSPDNDQLLSDHDQLQNNDIDNYYQYCNIGNNIVKLFLTHNSDFKFPLFRTHRYSFVNTFTRLRYIRYYLTYITTDQYQYFLKFLEATTIDDMKKEYDDLINSFEEYYYINKKN